MSVTIKAGEPTMLLAKRDESFVNMGFNESNMLNIFRSKTLESWQPERGPYNQITGTENGVCYYLVSKIDLQVGMYFAPPASVDWENVADYKTDENTWYDAFTAAIAATVSVVYVPAGSYDMTELPTVLINKPIWLMGGGGINRKCSIFTGTPNATIFDVDIPGGMGPSIGFKMTDVNMIGPNTSIAQTSGSCLRISNGFLFSVSDCNFGGSYDTIDVVKSFYWKIDGCNFDDSKHYMLRIRDVGLEDGGDQCVSNCWFGTTSGQDAIMRYESGGGLKLNNVKFNAAAPGFVKRSFDMSFNGQSIDLLINNCSIENYTEAGIKLALSNVPGSDFKNILLNNIEFYHSGGAGSSIDMNNMKNVVLGNLTFQVENNTDAVKITNCNRVKLGIMGFQGYTAPYSVVIAGSTNVTKVTETAA